MLRIWGIRDVNAQQFAINFCVSIFHEMFVPDTSGVLFWEQFF